jgi:uncharacterized protein (TIGR00369 family)
MALERLEAARFGFDSSCFVCNPENERGLRVPFFHDTDRDVIVAEFTLDEHFSGAPTLVHGGATLALMDEGMAWATIAIGGKFAVTRETSASFDWPVRLGRAYRLEARITEQDAKRMLTEVVVLDDKERPCVRGKATMVILDLDQATQVIGTEVSGEDAGFVRDDR